MIDKIEKDTNWRRVTVNKPFNCQNGALKDIVFSGAYIDLPTQRPGTKHFVTIRFFIAPHNQCPYDIILGDRELDALGYFEGLALPTGEIIFQHPCVPDSDPEVVAQTKASIDEFDRLGYLSKYGLKSAVVESILPEVIPLASEKQAQNSDENVSEIKELNMKKRSSRSRADLHTCDREQKDSADEYEYRESAPDNGATGYRPWRGSKEPTSRE